MAVARRHSGTSQCWNRIAKISSQSQLFNLGCTIENNEAVALLPHLLPLFLMLSESQVAPTDALMQRRLLDLLNADR